MKLTKDNAYAGARVKKGKDTLYILKVNDKSFYASPFEDVLEKWENRLKGSTFKNFIKGYDCKKYSYENFEIDKEVADKKEEIEYKKERKKKLKRYLTKQEERPLFDAIRRFEKKGSGARAPIEVSSKHIIYPIVFNKEKQQLLFRKDLEYIVYSIELDEYKKWGDHGEIKAKEENIPWFE